MRCGRSSRESSFWASGGPGSSRRPPFAEERPLRLLHGLDRFEADLDFTLLGPEPAFSFARYGDALVREVRAFGFVASLSRAGHHKASPLKSAFLKADTQVYRLDFEEIPERLRRGGYRPPPTRIRIEIDADPPPGFAVESRTLPVPVPFSVRSLVLPDLLCVKLHALLRRRYNRRAKGRDWYDLAWFAGNHPSYNAEHLEARLRQGGQLPEGEALTGEGFLKLAAKVIKILDVDEARREVKPYVTDPGPLDAWSPEFFLGAFRRLVPVGAEEAGPDEAGPSEPS